MTTWPTPWSLPRSSPIGEVAKTVKATDKRDAYVVITAKTGDNNAYTMPKDSRHQGLPLLEFETRRDLRTIPMFSTPTASRLRRSSPLPLLRRLRPMVTKTINSASDLDKNNGMIISGTEYKMSRHRR